MKDPIWFWVNPTTNATLSPQFTTQAEAELWFDRVIELHEQTYDLLDRVKNGKFFMVSGKIDVDKALSGNIGDCPYEIHLEDDILSVEVLALNLDDAKTKVKKYFEILEWVE